MILKWLSENKIQSLVLAIILAVSGYLAVATDFKWWALINVIAGAIVNYSTSQQRENKSDGSQT